MNRFINLFHKKHLIILIGIFFLSVSSVESHYHEDHDINHSEAECHFCINDLFDDNIDIPSEKLFLSDLNNFHINNPINKNHARTYDSQRREKINYDPLLFMNKKYSTWAELFWLLSLIFCE